jgi:hypothetical protein
VEIQLPTATRLAAEGPLVRGRAILLDEYLRELLENGFPARLRYRVELWADGRFFDELQRSAEWEVRVVYRAVQQQYEVIQLVGERPLSLGSFVKLEDADAAASRPVRVPLRAPAEDRRFYYLVTLEVEALSVSDLDEVNRWLSGDLSPAVRGQRNPGSALGRGLRSLATRLLGGERRTYEEQSPTFRPAR